MTSQVNGSLLVKDKKLQILDLKPKDEWTYHFWFGLKCGYPLCCIIWFLDCQTNGGKQENSLFENILREAYDETPITSKSPDRAMCPECLLRYIK